MALVIEKNIPAPAKDENTEVRDAIRAMEVGDSVAIPAKSAAAAAITFSANASRMGGDFSSRKFKAAELGAGNFRVWRVA